MTTIWRRALHPLGPVGAQGLAQAMNLGAQLALLALLGHDRFADLGLGLMAASTVCFLGEIGLGSYFLRETARSAEWLPLWRQSVANRMMMVVVAFVPAWIGLSWGAPHPQAAQTVLLAALPGLLASTINPTPLLFGLGHVRCGSAAVLIRFATQSAGCLAIAWGWPQHAEAGIGLAFAAGLVLQATTGLWAGLPARALLPAWPRTMPPRPALRLWSLSLVGTVNDRTLPFLIGNARPDILAPALILIQVLQTLAGIVGQLDRVIVPAEAQQQHTQANWRKLAQMLLALIAFVLTSVILLTTSLQPGQHWVALLLLLEWATVVVGALVFAVVFARGDEGPVARYMLAALPLSTIAQVALSGRVALELLLILRLMVAASIVWQTGRHLKTPVRTGEWLSP